MDTGYLLAAARGRPGRKGKATPQQLEAKLLELQVEYDKLTKENAFLSARYKALARLVPYRDAHVLFLQTTQAQAAVGGDNTETQSVATTGPAGATASAAGPCPPAHGAFGAAAAATQRSPQQDAADVAMQVPAAGAAASFSHGTSPTLEFSGTGATAAAPSVGGAQVLNCMRALSCGDPVYGGHRANAACWLPADQGPAARVAACAAPSFTGSAESGGSQAAAERAAYFAFPAADAGVRVSTTGPSLSQPAIGRLLVEHCPCPFGQGGAGELPLELVKQLPSATASDFRPLWKHLVHTLAVLVVAAEMFGPDSAQHQRLGRFLNLMIKYLDQLNLLAPTIMFENMYVNIETGQEERPDEAFWADIGRGLKLSASQLEEVGTHVTNFEERVAPVQMERQQLASELAANPAAALLPSDMEALFSGLSLAGLSFFEKLRINLQKERQARVDAEDTMCMSVLSPLQMGKAIVACYPYIPDTVAIMMAVRVQYDDYKAKKAAAERAAAVAADAAAAAAVSVAAAPPMAVHRPPSPAPAPAPAPALRAQAAAALAAAQPHVPAMPQGLAMPHGSALVTGHMMPPGRMAAPGMMMLQGQGISPGAVAPQGQAAPQWSTSQSFR